MILESVPQNHTGSSGRIQGFGGKYGNPRCNRLQRSARSLFAGKASIFLATNASSCPRQTARYFCDDVALEHFTIEPDRNYLLPMIKDAQPVQGARFKVLSSPWTAPPWVKDTGWWHGGARSR